ncbi:MAG: hypothetical protein IJ489_02700 [Clostridia bacterium]|nr:hypothetical protein [Clostridia bacterium]
MREKIKSFLQKAEPFRFYGLRVIRVFLMYYLFIIVADLCTFSIPGGDPEMWNYNPVQHHGSASFALLITFICVCGIFVLYDPTARRHFCKNPPPEKTIFSEWGHIFFTYEFWCDVVGLVLFPLIVKSEVYDHPIWFFFRRDDLGEWTKYGLYLLTILPVFLIVEWIMRVRTRRYWREMTRAEAESGHLDGLALVFLSLLLIVGAPFVAQFYLMTFFAIIWVAFFPTTLLVVVGILAVVWLLSVIRALRIRRKFIRKLKKVCKTENIEISEIYHPYLSVILRKNHDFHFTVKQDGKTYACKMIAALSKGAQMVFLDEDIGYFKHGFQFRKHDIVFFRPKFYHSFEAEGADKNIYIVSPVPYEIRAVATQVTFQSEGTDFITESKRFRVLDNASALYGGTLFSGDGFISALKRHCLDKSEL